MGKIYLEGRGIIKHQGAPITEYVFDEDEEIIFEFLPFALEGIKSIPYAVTMRLECGEFITDSDLITTVQWGDDYEARFAPLIIDTYEPPKALAQNAVYTSDGDIVVTVYKDTKTRIIAEGPGMFFIHTPTSEIEQPEVRINQSNTKIVAAITGTVKDMNYLLILMIDKACRILYEDIANTITYNQNNIKITRNLNDMKGRIVNITLTYDGNKYKELSRTYECTYDHKYKPVLIPYALIEAIIAGDNEDAKTYLDTSLDVNGLGEFFGDIVEVTEPKYKDYSDNCVAVISGKGKNLIARIYQFEIDNNIITNILEL